MDNKQLIQKTLNHSELSYGQMVYQGGLLWINRYFFFDELMEDIIQRSAMFWGWWKQQWSLRDAEFVYQTSLTRIELPLTGNELLIALDLYYDAHNVHKLRITPNRFVTKEINDLLKQELHKTEQLLKTLQNGIHKAENSK